MFCDDADGEGNGVAVNRDEDAVNNEVNENADEHAGNEENESTDEHSAYQYADNEENDDAIIKNL